jgi:hypothetical protein
MISLRGEDQGEAKTPLPYFSHDRHSAAARIESPGVRPFFRR